MSIESGASGDPVLAPAAGLVNAPAARVVNMGGTGQAEFGRRL
jgi:hypothetical protein